MKEIDKKQPDMQVLPPLWCGNICRNSMNQVCIEHCAIKRDCSYFEPLRDLKLYQLPPFPKTNEMSREEKFSVVALYLEKIVCHLQGTEGERLVLPEPTRSIQITGNQLNQILKVLTNSEDSPQKLESKAEV